VLLRTNNYNIQQFKVYRIYDNRYRETHRSYDAYLAKALQDIVGECSVVLNVLNQTFPRTEEKENDKKELTIIVTPYRSGTHTCTMPTAFLPIIDHLIALHGKNYVHGDIRAYNMVFGDYNQQEGWLIDFDFAGLCNTKKVPPNYRGSLDDGSRLGQPGKTITKYHDWYALFSVIFHVHKLYYPENMNLSVDLKIRLLEMQNRLEEIPRNGDVPSTVTFDLKNLLIDFEQAGGRFKPSKLFSESLEQCISNTLITNHEGTGSPTIK
jgi:hypothetical protein